MEMEYRLNKPVLDAFLAKKERGARKELCKKMGASGSFLDTILRTGHLPQGRRLFALADAIGRPVEDLVIRIPRRNNKSA